MVHQPSRTPGRQDTPLAPPDLLCYGHKCHYAIWLLALMAWLLKHRFWRTEVFLSPILPVLKARKSVSHRLYFWALNAYFTWWDRFSPSYSVVHTSIWLAALSKVRFLPFLFWDHWSLIRIFCAGSRLTRFIAKLWNLNLCFRNCWLNPLETCLCLYSWLPDAVWTGGLILQGMLFGFA